MSQLVMVEVKTLLAPLIRVQVPGRFALGLAAAFALVALENESGVFEVSVSIDGAIWFWSTDMLAAGDQIFRKVRDLKEMVC